MKKDYSKAELLYIGGHNCSQAVVCSHVDKYDIPEKYAVKFSASFGHGVSGYGELCGALSGLAMLIGIDLDFDNPTKDNKNLTYQITHEMIEIFKNKNGSIRCDELKGKTSGKILRSCIGCVENSNEIFEYYLANKDNLLKKYSYKKSN